MHQDGDHGPDPTRELLKGAPRTRDAGSLGPRITSKRNHPHGAPAPCTRSVKLRSLPE